MDISLDKKLQGFQLIAQEKLQAIIYSIPGKKDLILEPTLIKPLEHVCAASWLKLKGIQRIYKYDPLNIIPRAADQVHIYMIRSNLHTYKSVLQQIHHSLKTNLGESGCIIRDAVTALKFFHIICIPSCFSYFRTLLEAEGMFGIVQLHQYSWDFIYLDQGVLSMELTGVFNNVFMQRNTSLLSATAQSLRILQMLCGRPELQIAFGENSTNIINMLNALGQWTKNDETPSDFAALVIIDRDKDFASSLLTPAIYAGLLLEVFEQRAGEIAIETNANKILNQKLKKFLPPKQQQQQKTETTNKTQKMSSKTSSIRLNAQADEIYGDNRYKHFAQASSLVRAQAKAIGLEVQKLNDMKLDEMHDYVARKLPKVTELKAKILRHLNASEIVIEMLARNFRKVQSLEQDILNVSRKSLLSEIDELLTTDGQICNTLRLLCLLHLCSGIAADELQQFARNYCNYFGHERISVFVLLAKAGLLPQLTEDVKMNNAAKLLSNLSLPKFQQTEFQANANRLKLLVKTDTSAETNGSNAACPSFVFNNLYIPLVAQICSILLKSTNCDDFAAKLGMLDKIQIHLSKSAGSLTVKGYANIVKQDPSIVDIFPLNKRNIFVYIVGGVTYAEIAAIDLISRLTTGSQIIVASDCIISGSDLISAAL